jgi:transcriptional regulator with XRE-family HTH domain
MVKEQTLGQRIKTYRLDRGWSQVEMAQHLGVSRVLVIQIEGEKANLMDLTRAKIERRLGLRVSAVA